jgi:Cu(I)/Ag(I) efflux system periplasmic protein CusF
MKSLLPSLVLAIASAGVASFALAQAPAGAPAAAAPMTEAEVRKVDREARKVTLKHGPIKNLDMPPMTMVFQVRDPALLDRLVAGETIRFSAEQQQGAYVLTAVEKAAR